ncbi:Universal stress protein A-like protein [Quillaja saponaria]|uniref:Universal stress protein A-like protein n=1 Tax=Quillaja saponaria TaxID=32244 RepID=A0AAD7VHH5_QUISA|nr:Universal stress protein A-like protein [Quillaja saponaria]
METTGGVVGGQVSDGAGTATGAEVRRPKMKVMVAIDESDGSFYALKWALDNLFPTIAGLGSSTPEASLGNVGIVYLVHVIQPFHQYIVPAGPGGAVFTTPSLVESVRKAQEESAAAILSRALQMCKDKLIKAETITFTGDPKELICQATEQMPVDLLLIGSRGLGMLQRAFIGSVSDYCAHHAKCSILIVKPPREHHHTK